jgi:hypothetical protein
MMTDDYSWRKPTHSMEAGNCVEMAEIELPWHSRCGESFTCVQVAKSLIQVAMRDSKDPTGPWLWFSHGAWHGFIDDVKDGVFNFPATDRQ